MVIERQVIIQNSFFRIIHVKVTCLCAPTYPRNTQWIDSSTLTKIKSELLVQPQAKKKVSQKTWILNLNDLHLLTRSTCSFRTILMLCVWNKMKRKLPITKRFRIWSSVYVYSWLKRLLVRVKSPNFRFDSSCAMFAPKVYAWTSRTLYQSRITLVKRPLTYYDHPTHHVFLSKFWCNWALFNIK